jgi:hypothetical protein
MSTREEALAELAQVFEMIAAEYREKGMSLPLVRQTAAGLGFRRLRQTGSHERTAMMAHSPR